MSIKTDLGSADQFMLNTSPVQYIELKCPECGYPFRHAIAPTMIDYRSLNKELTERLKKALQYNGELSAENRRLKEKILKVNQIAKGE